MDNLVSTETARDVTDVGNGHKIVSIRHFFTRNVFNWHLRISISIQLIDFDIFNIAFDFDRIYFPKRNSMGVVSKVLSIDSHQKFLVCDQYFDGKAVAAEKVIASREHRASFFLTPVS